MSYPYTMTNDTLTVILDTGTFTTAKGNPNFAPARQAVIQEDWAALEGLFTVGHAIQRWMGETFKYDPGAGGLTYEGVRLPLSIENRILATASEDKDPRFLLNFWANLQENPSHRSVEQLYAFLEHMGIPITEEGYFLAYKGVQDDYLDRWSRTIDNTPGVGPIRVPRNTVSDDPNTPCAGGLHVGDESYAVQYAGTHGRVVICRVNPRDVVCVPYDSAFRKVRVCEYEPIGHHAGTLSSTTYEELPSSTDESTAPEAEVNDLATEEDLYNLSLDVLRKYACHNLKIIGASKLPGGKLALIEKIKEVRG